MKDIKKEGCEMTKKIKTFVEERGIEIHVNGVNLNFYKDGEKVAEVTDFTQSKKETAKGIGLKFNYSWGIMKENNGMLVKEETYKEIVRIKEETEDIINRYFENLDNVEMYCLNNRYYYIDEETKGYKETKKLNIRYFKEIERNWMNENIKNLVKTGEKVEPYQDTIYYYEFTKTNAKDLEEKREEYKQTDEYKKQREITNRYSELAKMAETMSDKEFEEKTGLLKEHIL